MTTDRPVRRDLTDPLTDDEFYAGDPYSHYARLRAEAPLVWHPDPGYWVSSRHDDVLEASRDPDRFCSGRGILTFEIGVEYPTPPTMMHTDPPLHTRLRQRLSPAFRPSRIAALEASVTDRANAVVDAALDAVASVGDSSVEIDAVASIAVPFPLMVIADLLGIDREDWPRFHRWSDAFIPDATDWPPETLAALREEMELHLREVVAQRRASPREDLISDLVAGPDGCDDDEAWMFLNQLLVAGNETTRNLISGSIVEFCRRHDQWDLLRADRSLIPGAVEELLRWTTPVIAFMRTAVADTVLGGQTISAGDPVLLLYASANRDEAEFGASADRLDVARSPNHHLAFGFGPHFCVGAALARLEVAVLLTRLLDRVERWDVAAPPQRTPSGIIAGWRCVPVRVTATVPS